MDDAGVLSIDFIFATLIALIIIAGMVSIVDSELSRTQTGELGEARMVGERVAGAVNAAYTNGPGFAANITIPSHLNCTVEVRNGEVRVFYGTYTVNLDIIPKVNVTTTNMTPGKYTVMNRNGTVIITRI
ncbi:hypothetical protein U2150_02805 [Methanothermobacter wolfeii]|uniref:Uncharacterized protein n=1 Tax=Methanothermobacter wolfeii TaxID=145261 RepID=A0ABU8TTP0_METWO|nr:putative protein {ECO:0000313/EMBL:AAB84935,1} [Methanothermobacter wolfeii]